MSGVLEMPHWGVSTRRNWKPGTLGAIIIQFKSTHTKRIRSEGYDNFAWQSRYYDRIIRNDEEMERIFAYKQGNPAKWMEDKYYA